MKKISIIFMVVALAIFAACSGGTKTAEKADEGTNTATEAVSSDSGSSSSSSVLSQYEAFVEKAIPLLQKMKAGDAAAMTEYAKIAQELSDFMTTHQEDFANLSVGDLQKYQELAQKLAGAAQ